MGFNTPGMNESIAQIFYDFISYRNQIKIDDFNFLIHDKSSLKQIRLYFLEFVKKLKELVENDNVIFINFFKMSNFFNRI